jgi:SAM-dependent methyltransferase
VDWEGRLALEIPFLSQHLSSVSPQSGSGQVLDAACGTGHHAVALANLGFHVVGVDLSASMIDIATSLEVEGEGLADFHVGDMAALKEEYEEGHWDGILCLGNALPHILDEEKLLTTLIGFKKLLQREGRLILQINNFQKIVSEKKRWLPVSHFQEGAKLWIFSRFYDFDPDGFLTFNILILSKAGPDSVTQQVISTRLRPLQRDDLIALLRRAGFSRFTLFGDLQGNDFQLSNSPNLVICAS